MAYLARIVARPYLTYYHYSCKLGPVMAKICGATTKSGKICTLTAGWGTGHYGEGRCKYHGGAIADVNKPNRFLETLIDPDPRIRERALQLLEDEDLLNCRAELAILKARLDMKAFDSDAQDSEIVSLVRAIVHTAKAIDEMERGKQHYLHVTVTGAIVSAFAEIGRSYITDPAQRYRFQQDIEGVIRKAIRARGARAVATSLLAPKVAEAKEKLLEKASAE